MTGLIISKSSEIGHFVLYDSRRLPRPCDFPSGISFLLSTNNFLGEVSSSQMRANLRKKVVSISRSRCRKVIPIGIIHLIIK